MHSGKLAVQSYWFQREGRFDRDRRRWIPNGPMPEFFEFPGPVNVHLRPDMAAVSVPSHADELAFTIARWERVRWPRVSRAMRQQYAERRRHRTTPFRQVTWQRLGKIDGFDSSVYRVDVYGNVLMHQAERYSLTAWNVDHVFPYSRGGLTQEANLRALNERANSVVKGARFDALIVPNDMRAGLGLAEFREQHGREDFGERFAEARRNVVIEMRQAEEEREREEAAAEMLCDACFLREATHTCSGCEQYQFCGDACADAHWRSNAGHYHRLLCVA